MIRLKILQYDDHVTPLLPLFDEHHLHITDISFRYHCYDRHHDIYHGKYPELITK